jgi:hypothetical protein
MRRLLHVLVAVVPLALLASPAQAQDKTSPNMSLVDNIPYKAYGDRPANYGTDIEFAKLDGRRHAIGGSYYNGLHIVDVSQPENARLVGRYDCAILQGDVQIFKSAKDRTRTFATYTADSASTETDSKCFQDAERLGFDAVDDEGTGRQGTFIVDITNPRKPTTVSFVEVPQGSHNMTVHPSGGWLYNSNSELITNSPSPAIEIIDIRNPAKPKTIGELPLTPLPGLGTESHDITFSDDGKRAYSAALSHGVVIDTTNPAKPTILSEFDDESINVWHQSDPVTLQTPEGEKTFLIAEDEFAGAAGGPVCPSGGVHIYDITGEKEKAPEKVGYWNIDDFGPTHDPAGTCTAHVFDIHEKQQLMTMAFYNGGVRVIDLAGLATGEGIKAIGSYQAEDADTWSFKAPRVTRSGVFYAYGNDIARGMDVYRYDGRRPQATNPGTWIPGPALSLPAGGGSEQSTQAAAPNVVGGITQVAAGAAKATTTATGTTARAASTRSLDGYRLSCLLKTQS